MDQEEDRIPLPPSDANIPTVPSGFVPTPGNDFRGVTPKTAHKAALPDVIEELARFDDFAEVFGKTTPPHALTQEVVQAAYAWTEQRARMRAWDLYCRTQEGLAWRELRAVMRRLAAAYDLAATTDSTIASRYPGFARLLRASREISKKSVETRKANARLLLEGLPAYRGQAGQRRRKAVVRSLFAQRAATGMFESTPGTKKDTEGSES
jgi:hypothetical protein